LSVEQLYSELESRFRTARPNEDFEPLRQAYLFAAEHHQGQVRDSGEPFLAHPLQVALILADMNLDMVCLQTGLLHDVVEDTPVRLEDVQKRFGHEVARCVDGVTKISKLNLHCCWRW
jgi:GTP pyrophosphokinase